MLHRAIFPLCCALLIIVRCSNAQSNASSISLISNNGSEEVVSESAEDDHELGDEAEGCPHEKPKRYPLAGFHFCHVHVPLVVAGWLLLASLAEVGFNLSKHLSDFFPDSALLIVLGLIVGALLKYTGVEGKEFQLDSEVFFLFLLPPVVFEAGYFIPRRALFDNLGSILCFAVLGTLFNTLAVGLSLWGLSSAGAFGFAGADALGPLKALLFASLVSAVDPVAVLSVFEAVHVNEVLYILIFGESLLNDAVSVVLYRVFGTFVEMEAIEAVDYAAAFGSFFVSSLGGLFLGLLCAVGACLITKKTEHTRVLEPLVVLVAAYLSYVLAELFAFSGILAIAFCGLIMREYIYTNISRKSATTVKYFLKMLSRSCEGIMFLFLGTSAVAADHQWDTAFVLLTILLCLVFRAVGVVLQSVFLNRFRVRGIKRLDQFIMSYAGLRGAIAYGLVAALDDDVIGYDTKHAFLTATIVLILFTVFVQGTTIKPIVGWLKVARDEEDHKSLANTLLKDSLDHAVAGAEAVAGRKGHNWWRQKWQQLNTSVICPLLMLSPPVTANVNIVETHRKLSYAQALNEVRHATHSPQHSRLDLKTLAPPGPPERKWSLGVLRSRVGPSSPPAKVSFSIGVSQSVPHHLESLAEGDEEESQLSFVIGNPSSSAKGGEQSGQP